MFDNGTQEILLKAGVRYDDFDLFDSETTFQFGVEVQAIEDLKVRGTYGTVYRAPNIGELFGGVVDSFPQYVDPCTRVPLPAGCAQVGLQLDTQVRAAVGGNINLIPESGDTYTVGVVWTPSFGDHNFTGTLDYWSVELEDGINALGAQFILDDCYENLNAAACALVTRDANYAVTLVRDTALNLSSQTAKGVDTEIRWNFSSNIGDWEASMLWAHMLERNSEAFAGAGETEFAGRFTAGSSAFAEDKMNYKLQWMQGGFTVAYLGEYISALDADTFCNCGDGNQPDGSYIQKIDAQLYHDLVASYSFSDYGMEGLTLAGGITNFTDEAPPFIEVGFNAGTDPSTYRMFGIGYYLRATYKF